MTGLNRDWGTSGRQLRIMKEDCNSVEWVLPRRQNSMEASLPLQACSELCRGWKRTLSRNEWKAWNNSASVP